MNAGRGTRNERRAALRSASRVPRPAFPGLARALAAAALAVLLPACAARAQESLRALTEDGEGAHAPEETCKGAPLAGAESVHVVVRSNEEVLLVGASGDRVVWKRKLPLRDLVNTPKTYPSCEGQKVVLYSQMPFSAAAVVQTFSWDGRALRFVSLHAEDPSAEFMEKALAAAEAGDAAAVGRLFKQTDEGEFGMMYPGAYVTGHTLGAALGRGRRAALAEHRAGRAAEAARRLALMFDVTTELAALAVAEADPATPQPARWLAVWKEAGVEPREYLAALNDYGFYLQEAGDHAAAHAPLALVVGQDPARRPARLNLADTLWALGRRDEARTHYRAYRQMMKGAGRDARRDARVAERMR